MAATLNIKIEKPLKVNRFHSCRCHATISIQDVTAHTPAACGRPSRLSGVGRGDGNEQNEQKH